MIPCKATSWLRAAFVTALCAASAGCVAVDDDNIVQSADVALSPSAFVVPPIKVMESAERFAATRPNTFIFYTQTDDMLPRYAQGTALVAEPLSYRQLKRGMTVVFYTRTGSRIAHTLIAQSQDGWVTRALNRPQDDPDLMTGRNYLGVVVTAFAPDSKRAQ